MMVHDGDDSFLRLNGDDLFMSGYRMVSGLALFLVVVFAILIPAASRYPELRPTGDAENWPPDFPSLTVGGANRTAPPGCEAVVLCMNVVIYWISAFFEFLVGGFIFLAGTLVAVVKLLIGLVTWDLPNMPDELNVIVTALRIVFVFVIALFIFRLIRSVNPFSGSES